MEFDFKRNAPLEFDYLGKRVKTATQLDFVIGDSLLLQVHSQEAITKQEEQQMESMLKLCLIRTGLLVNFNVPKLRKGIHQVTIKPRDHPKA